MKTFKVYSNSVSIFYATGHQLVIFFTPNTGKVFFRYKIDTISNIKHPGILVGSDMLGTRYFLHNHFEKGKPCLVTEQEFSKGQPLQMSNEPTTNSAQQIISNGLNQVLQGSPYSAITHNCQNFVNRAVINIDRSEAVERFKGAIMLTLLILLGGKLFK